MRLKGWLPALSICVLFGGTGTLRAQVVQSDCTAPAAFLAAYDQEIKFLALEWMFASHSPDTELIDIPLSQLTPIRDGLAAVFNTGTQLSADSVFSLYCIQSDPVYRAGAKELQVVVDTSYGWTHAWLQGQTATTVAPLDQILGQYGFTVYSHVTNPGAGCLVILRTQQVVNTHALAESLRSFPGVLLALPGTDLSVMYPLNRISYTVDAGGSRHFSCRLGWGMLNYQYWNYKVNPGCSVELEQTQQYASEPLPPLKNCNLFPTAVTTPAGSRRLQLFPNPAIDYLEWPAGMQEGGIYRIYDGAGKPVRTGTAAPGARIGVSGLPQGLYFLHIVSGTGTRTGGRFLKQ